MSKKIILTILGISAVFLTLFIFVGRNKIKERDINNSYTFSTVENGDIVQTVGIDGTVVADQEIDLRFQVGGMIEKINYKTGDEVKKGDLLASLKSNDQAIALRQREASLSQVRANLNLKLTGASDEDLAVFQSKVESSKNNIQTTLDSTAKDVESAKARISSAQTALDNAVTNLDVVKKQNDVDLETAYTAKQRTVYSSILSIDKTLDVVKDILEDDDLEDLFSVKDSQYKILSSIRYNQTRDSFDEISRESELILNTEYYKLDNLSLNTENTLGLAADLLSSIFNGLISTITSSDLSQATLDSYKTNINALRAEINLAISSIESNRQSILSLKTGINTKITNAESVISASQATLNLEKANLNYVESRVSAQNSQMKDSLRLAENELALKESKPRDVDIAYLRARVYEASSLVDLARENLNKTNIFSPVDGVIADIKFDVGESINTPSIFIELTTNEKKIEALIPEIEVAKVDVDDSVEISLDAFVNRVFDGKILSIDPAETNIQGVVYYQTDIVFSDASSSELVLSGMTADINILTDSRKDVLILPINAVKKEANKFYVQILNGNEVTFKNIEIGLFGDNNVEIISGLKDGDKVLDFVL